MMILPDTTAISRHLRGQDPALSAKLRAAIEREELVYSIVVHSELASGAEKARLAGDSRPHARLAQLLLSLVVETIPPVAAGEYGRVRALLEKRGETIGAMDLLLAAHALALDAAVVTHNTREFRRVPGLRVEDWQLGD